MNRISRRPAGAFAVALVLCALLYFPGLRGGFLFDDFPNIVANPAVHVGTLDLGEWKQALWASPSSNLQRPLASLSFAVNHYFSALAPLPMKATNLAIHLLNGWLLYLLLRRVLAQVPPAAGESGSRTEWLATAVAALWLLHPINLTPVLLVVQRMESLAQLFVLAGLILYLDARQRQQDGQPGAGWRLWLGFPAAMVLGVAAKESAALLPLYALLLEIFLLRGKGKQRALGAFFVIFLVLPALIGMLWMLPGAFSEGAYASRSFTLVERLLTEPRVLLDYVLWTLLPAPQMFSFFHDDYVVSTGLFRPWGTLPAILILAGATLGAWWLRNKRPLASLGWCWFLAAHALTASVFPLELVFEHRNYFASIGLLLAVTDLLLPGRFDIPFARARVAAVTMLALLTAFSLMIRAKVWGDPLLLAITEASHRPQSPRATYHLGATYAALSGYRAESPNLQRAIDTLEAAARVPGASTMPESALIITSARSGRPVEAGWIDSMEHKLATRKPTPEDENAVAVLTQCQRDDACGLDDARLTKLYKTALDRLSRSPSILYSYGIHAHNRLHDPSLALELVREAARTGDLQFQVNLVNFLVALGHGNEARQELAVLEQRDRRGSMTREISSLRSQLASMQ